MSIRKLWENRTARILLIAGAALLLLLACWLVFGRNKSANAMAGGASMTEEEARLSAILSEVEDAGEVRVFITQEDGAPVSAIVLFSGTDGILVRLRLTQIAAQALDIAEKRVLVYPSET